MGFDALGVLCPPSTSTCSATWKLSEPIYEDFYEGFTVEAQLIKSLAIGDWWLVIGSASSPSPFLQGLGI